VRSVRAAGGPGFDQLIVGAPRERRLDSTSRVWADVVETPLWFESPDVSLAPSTEAFGSALYLSALHQRVPLVLSSAVDPAWLGGVTRLAETVIRWWGYSPSPPIAPATAPARERRAGVALCFSGGVDSFYTLLRGGVRPDWLCCMHGYDIPIDDRSRAGDLEARVRAIAAAVGSRAALLRTNLRKHPAFTASNWDRAHGGALAAVGHLLSEECGTLVISSTFDYADGRPWGSHWRIDPLWSSSATSVVHAGAHIMRERKLKEIADEPLVQQNLRVCWQEHTTRLNCCRCDKCLVAMVTLHQLGKLEQFPVFEAADSLADRLDELPGTIYLRMYRRLVPTLGDPRLRGAVERLIARSGPELA
jgi:hypothetical protein